MDLELSADQQALAESVRDFVDAECPVSLVRRVVEQHPEAAKEVDELWARMVGLDWPGLAVPEEDGGIGLGQVEVAVVAEQLGRVLCPAPFLAGAAQFVPVVAEAGSAEQRRRFLGAAASGVVGTLALAEPGGRFSVEQVETSATEADGGGAWLLNGEKHYVFDAAHAQEFVVAARVQGSASHTGGAGGAGGAGGLALFVVPRGSLEVTALHGIDGSRSLGTVTLDDVEVGPDRVLGTPGVMGPQLDRALEPVTVSLAAEMVGTSQAIFDIVLTYVKEREQFGVKIGSFQAMKHKLANMYVALEAARATVYFAAAAIDEDDERRTVATSMAKSAAGDCQKLMAQEGIQCLGGIGYTWEHDMHMYVKRQKVQAAMFGTAAGHRARIAARLGL